MLKVPRRALHLSIPARREGRRTQEVGNLPPEMGCEPKLRAVVHQALGES